MGMSQAQFAETFGIGSPGMIWQYLNGYTPLNIWSAAKFAEGLGCRISDISPEMEAECQQYLDPARGLKKWRRVAAVALPFVLLVPLLVILLLPPQAQANALGSNIFLKFAGSAYYVTSLVRRFLTRAYSFFAIERNWDAQISAV